MHEHEETGRASGEEEPCYVISIAAKMLGMHQQTLRYYERMGIVAPSRSRGNIRLYSQADIQRLRKVQQLIAELGVNLSGAEIILKMNARIRELEHELENVRAEVDYHRARITRQLDRG